MQTLVYQNRVSPVAAARATASQLGIVTWSEGDSTVIVKHNVGGMSVQRHLLNNPDNSWVARIQAEDVSNHINLAGIPRCIKTTSEAVKLIQDVFVIGLGSSNIGFDDITHGK